MNKRYQEFKRKSTAKADNAELRETAKDAQSGRISGMYEPIDETHKYATTCGCEVLRERR
jgi:hypothetical protein